MPGNSNNAEQNIQFDHVSLIVCAPDFNGKGFYLTFPDNNNDLMDRNLTGLGLAF